MSTPDHRPVRQEIQQNIKINRLEQCGLQPLTHTSRSRISPQDMVGGYKRVECRLKYVMHSPRRHQKSGAKAPQFSSGK